MTEVYRSAIDLIRARPHLYFPHQDPTLHCLVSMVVEDATARNVSKVVAMRDDPFALVSSDCDWMITPRATLDELFQRFVAPDTGIANGFRSEVMIAATCVGYLTLGAESLAYQLNLHELPLQLAAAAKATRRALAWKFDPVAWTAMKSSHD